MSHLLQHELKRAGFETLIAADAMLGTRHARQWKPDLILIDMMLPAAGGLGVLENMKQLEHTKSIPIIVLTSSKDSTGRARALALGIQSVIQKPHDPEALIAEVRRLTSTSKKP